MTDRGAVETAATRACAGPRRLRVAVPWLTRQVVECAGAVEPEAARWLAGRGRRMCAPDEGWRQWLLGDSEPGAGVLERFPAGPCIRAARTRELPRGTWACATPVHLLTAIDHLQIAPPGPVALGADEAAAVAATLGRHFAGAGHAFLCDAHGGLLWSCARHLQCTSVEPSLAVGANLRELMPAGRDGQELRTLMNEVQMLLHEHPVNANRIARGEVPVNALWLWGIGSVREATSTLPRLFSDDEWLLGLAWLHGSGSGAPRDFAGSLATPGGAVAVGWADPAQSRSTAQALAEVESECFRPVRDALVRGLVAEVDLRLGDQCWRLKRGDRWRMWRRARRLSEILT